MNTAAIISAVLSLIGLLLKYKMGKSNERDLVRAEMTEAFLKDFNDVRAIDAALAGHGDTEWIDGMRNKWGFPKPPNTGDGG